MDNSVPDIDADLLETVKGPLFFIDGKWAYEKEGKLILRKNEK